MSMDVAAEWRWLRRSKAVAKTRMGETVVDVRVRGTAGGLKVEAGGGGEVFKVEANNYDC